MAVGLVEENSGLQIPVLSGQGDGIDDVFGCGGIFRKLDAVGGGSCGAFFFREGPVSVERPLQSDKGELGG